MPPEAGPVLQIQADALVYLPIIPEQAVHILRPAGLFQRIHQGAQCVKFVFELDLQSIAALLGALQDGLDGLLPQLLPHRVRKQEGDKGQDGAHQKGYRRNPPLGLLGVFLYHGCAPPCVCSSNQAIAESSDSPDSSIWETSAVKSQMGRLRRSSVPMTVRPAS